jgi:hypothetical protein
MQTGCAYVPGLGLQLAGFYFLLADEDGLRLHRRAWLAGVTLALSVCVWFPYLFGMPCVFVYALLIGRRDWSLRGHESLTRLRWLGEAFAVFGVTGAVIYSVGIWQAGIRSPAEFIQWAVAAGHGYQQTKTLIRIGTGLPRGMLDMGQMGLTIKRLLLHDPYAQVGIADVFRNGLWKLALFYLGLLSLVWTLVRDRAARPVLYTLLMGGGLALFFAIVLTYPGQQERWMPFFVGLLPATAWVFRSRRSFRASTLPFAILLAVTWVTDFTFYKSVGEPGVENSTVARLLVLKAMVTPQSTVSLVSGSDDINDFRGRYPFNHYSRLFGPLLYVVTEASSGSSPRWRQSFAARTLLTWQNNGDMWISKRLLAERPMPDWKWAEGDDPYLRWRDIPVFFRGFAFDGDTAGTDGFLRIARNPQNRTLLDKTGQ